MKTASFLFALAIALSVSLPVLASDQAKDSKQTKPKAVEKAKKAEPQHVEEKGVLTGSYIKQKVRRQGMITDGANNVQVIDRNTIERSGASDVRQLLVHQGIH